MSETKYDQLLREFLEEQRDSRARGVTLEALHEKQDRMYLALQRLARRILDDDARLSRFSRRIRQVENQLSMISSRPEVPVPEWHADPREITGTHQYHEIQRQLRHQEEAIEEGELRRRDSSTWWRRKRREWLVAAIGFTVALVLTSAVGALAFFLSRSIGR